jgi:hypothetical protein
VLGAALVRDVLSFFWVMSMDIRPGRRRRKQARAILGQLLAPLQPQAHKGGLFSTDLTSLYFLRPLLEDYEPTLATIQPIVRSTKEPAALLSALQQAYPDIPQPDLCSLVKEAQDSYNTAQNRLRADRLTEAILGWQYGYGSEDPDSIRTARTRARQARKIQEALDKLGPSPG